MTAAMTALANITLGSAQSTVTFSSIPATYRDLRLVGQIKPTSTGNALKVQFNSDTGTNYSMVSMAGDGSSAVSASSTANDHIRLSNNIGASADLNNIFTLDIMDYSATDKHKSTLTRMNTPSVGTEALANRWASTSAITSLRIYFDLATNNIAIGTTLTLYGIVS